MTVRARRVVGNMLRSESGQLRASRRRARHRPRARGTHYGSSVATRTPSRQAGSRAAPATWRLTPRRPRCSSAIDHLRHGRSALGPRSAARDHRWFTAGPGAVAGGPPHRRGPGRTGRKGYRQDKTPAWCGNTTPGTPSNRTANGLRLQGGNRNDSPAAVSGSVRHPCDPNRRRPTHNHIVSAPAADPAARIAAPWTVRWLALGAIVGPALFTVAWLVLGFLSPGYTVGGDWISPYSPISQPISGLGMGVTGPYMNTASILSGLVLIAGLVGIFQTIPASGRPAARWLCAATLALSPLGLVVAGIFTLDHLLPHFVGFGLVAATPVITFATTGIFLRGIPTWRRFGTYLILGSPLTLLLLILYLTTFDGPPPRPSTEWPDSPAASWPSGSTSGSWQWAGWPGAAPSAAIRLSTCTGRRQSRRPVTRSRSSSRPNMRITATKKSVHSGRHLESGRGRSPVPVVLTEILRCSITATAGCDTALLARWWAVVAAGRGRAGPGSVGRGHGEVGHDGVHGRAGDRLGMRVVRVIGVREPGGAQLSALRLSRALAGFGVASSLLFAGDATGAGMGLAGRYGVAVEAFSPGAHRRLQWTPDEAFVEWLRPRLAGADLVHAHMFGAWWAAAAALEGTGTPLVASEHNAVSWPYGDHSAAAKAAAARLAAFFAHGPAVRAFAAALGLDPGLVHEGRSAVEGLDAWPLPDLAAPRLTFTGRFREDKGPDLLVEALPLLADDLGELPHCYLVGDGPMRAWLQRRIHELGLAERVRFTGWSYHPARYVAAAAVHVVPSREEAWSQSAVVAMGLGVPVVGTAVEGLPLTLGEGRGLLVAAEDPAALAAGIAGILRGEQRTDLRGGRAYAARFQAAPVAEQYTAVYRRVIHAHQAR